MTAWYASLYTGLFRRFGPVDARPHDPPLALFTSQAPSPLSPAGERGRGEGAAGWGPALGQAEGSGIGWDEEAAEAACVGEAIERLQAYPLPDDQFIEASFDDWPLAEPAVAPERWVLFHSEQYQQPGFPFIPLTPSTRCSWAVCRQAVSGQPWWVPVEMVYLHQRPGDSHRFCPGVSTGLACGRTGDPILLRGLQEVIERDAVVGAWWGSYALEEFSADLVLQGLGGRWRADLTRPNLRYRCFRVDSLFSRHVTIVSLEGEDREGFCFSLGSACRETRTASWSKAFLEAVHGRHYVRVLKQQVAQGQLNPGSCPRDFPEHAVYYSLHKSALAKTVLASPARGNDPFADGDEGIAELARRLGSERPILFRSMTPPALASEGLHWHVLRVVVPGLQPLHGSHALPHLGGTLWAPRSLADWSRLPPHPFA